MNENEKKSQSGWVLRNELKEREPEPRKEMQFAPNSKPPIFLRLSSGFIDIVILFFAIFGLYSLFNATPMTKPVRDFRTEMTQIQDATMLETGYGQKTVITPDNEKTYSGYIHYTDTDNTVYVVTRVENLTQEIYNSYSNALKANKRYQTVYFNYIFSNYGFVCLSIFIGEFVLYFVVPLTNKYRATIGQLFAGIQCINVRLENRARWYNLLGRFFFIFIVESALPFLMLSELTVLFSSTIVILWALFNRQTNRTIHDVISGTMLIHKKSYSPMVKEVTFEETDEEIAEEKTRIEHNNTTDMVIDDNPKEVEKEEKQE